MNAPPTGGQRRSYGSGSYYQLSDGRWRAGRDATRGRAVSVDDHVPWHDPRVDRNGSRRPPQRDRHGVLPAGLSA